jgi:hypothetical protein
LSFHFSFQNNNKRKTLLETTAERSEKSNKKRELKN